MGSSRHHLTRAVEAGLRRPGTHYIDLFQLHGFDAVTPVEETLDTLDDLVRAGKIRYIEVGQAKDKPLWDRWYYLVAMIGLMGTEWFLRRRFGYV